MNKKVKWRKQKGLKIRYCFTNYAYAHAKNVTLRPLDPWTFRPVLGSSTLGPPWTLRPVLSSSIPGLLFPMHIKIFH